MVSLFVILTLVSVLVILFGAFYQRLWWPLARAFYADPEAIAPSHVGFRVQAGALIVVGVVMLILCTTQIASFAGNHSNSEETTAEQCSTVTNQVGNPASAREAASAVREAASDGGYQVETQETSTEETLDLPADEEEELTIEVTTWTVLADDDEVAEFTWTEAPEALSSGKFSSSSCRS